MYIRIIISYARHRNNIKSFARYNHFTIIVKHAKWTLAGNRKHAKQQNHKNFTVHIVRSRMSSQLWIEEYNKRVRFNKMSIQVVDVVSVLRAKINKILLKTYRYRSLSKVTVYYAPFVKWNIIKYLQIALFINPNKWKWKLKTSIGERLSTLVTKTKPWNNNLFLLSR